MRLVGVIAMIALGVVVTGSAPRPARWHDAGLYVVDGQYLVGERPCPGDAAIEPLCRAMARGVQQGRSTTTASIEAIAIGSPPSDWRDASGKRILFAFGGLGRPVIAVIDLADGTREAMVLYCAGPVGDEAGATISELTCEPSDNDTYAVGGGLGVGRLEPAAGG